MKSYKITLLISIIIFSILCGGYIYNEYIIVLPTHSSPAYLTLSQNATYIDPKQVTIRHYVNGDHICDYVLNFEYEMHFHTFQKHKLPILKSGTIEVILELNRPFRNIITKKYNAKEIFFNGLLLYFDDNTDNKDYVYFISGNTTECQYDSGNYMKEWSVAQKFPSPKAFFYRWGWESDNLKVKSKKWQRFPQKE